MTIRTGNLIGSVWLQRLPAVIAVVEPVRCVCVAHTYPPGQLQLLYLLPLTPAGQVPAEWSPASATRVTLGAALDQYEPEGDWRFHEGACVPWPPDLDMGPHNSQIGTTMTDLREAP